MKIANLNDLKSAFVTCANQLKEGVTFTLTFEVFDEKSREQEKKYHAMLGDIAAQARHLNQVFTEDDWKRLCVDMFRKDCISNDVNRLADYWRKQGFKLVPSLDGSGLVTLGAQTKKFPKYVAAGFIEWLLYYGANCEPPIRWTDPSKQFNEYELQRYGT